MNQKFTAEDEKRKIRPVKKMNENEAQWKIIQWRKWTKMKHGEGEPGSVMNLRTFRKDKKYERLLSANI